MFNQVCSQCYVKQGQRVEANIYWLWLGAVMSELDILLLLNVAFTDGGRLKSVVYCMDCSAVSLSVSWTWSQTILSVIDRRSAICVCKTILLLSNPTNMRHVGSSYIGLCKILLLQCSIGLWVEYIKAHSSSWTHARLSADRVAIVRTVNWRAAFKGRFEAV